MTGIPALNSNAQYAYNYLKKRYGWSDIQAAGAVGNLMQESSFILDARNKGDGQDGSDSIGIGQWNGDRAKGLHSFAEKNNGSPTDINTQLDYYVWEQTQGPEKRAGQMLANAQNLNDAVIGGIAYERPAGFSWDNPANGHGYDNRLNYAKQAYENYSGNNPDEVLGNKPISPANSESQIQAKATEVKPEEAKSNNGILVNAYNKITGSNAQVPDTILGAKTSDVMKGIAGIGDFAKIMQGETDSLNKQASAAASRAASNRNSNPVEIQFASSITTDPRKKRKGGLSGLGGYLV